MSTIRRRLTWRLLLGWILLLGTGEGTAYFLARTALTRQFDEALRAKAMALAALSEQDGGRIEMELPPQFMGEFDTPESTAFFQLWRADGSVVRRSKSLRNARLPRRYGSLLVPECWNQP